MRLLEDPDDVQRGIVLDALGRLGDPAAAEAVVHVAATGHPSLTAQVPFVLARVSTPAGLVALLDNRTPAVRAAAALALGIAGIESGRSPLATALSDPVPAVREHVALGLGFFGAPDDVARLEATATGDPEPVVRDAALLALAMAGTAPAPRRLEAALAHADIDVRLRAAELLGWLRRGDTLDAVRTVAQHDVSDKVRGAARLAIDRITDGDV